MLLNLVLSYRRYLFRYTNLNLVYCVIYYYNKENMMLSGLNLLVTRIGVDICFIFVSYLEKILMHALFKNANLN